MPSSPPCSSLFFNKNTEVDDFKAYHLGLAEVTTTDSPDVVVDSFIRQVLRLSSLMRKVHL